MPRSVTGKKKEYHYYIRRYASTVDAKGEDERELNIAGGPKEARLPKNVGLLFFNEKSFTGPFGRITREALSYIQTNYLSETVLKHPDRPEAERFWNFPHPAVEEAAVNAVCHRSYEI